MRAFFAIPIKNSLWLQVENEYKQFQHYYHAFPIRWTNRDNLHITLQFIHSLDTSILLNLLRDISDQIATIEPFKITIEDLVIFPSAINPRAIALQAVPNEKIHELSIRIATAMSSNNIAVDKKPFRAHMTIGRVRNIKKIPYAVNKDIVYGEQLADSVTLYSSERNANGSAYIPIAQIPLGNSRKE